MTEVKKDLIINMLAEILASTLESGNGLTDIREKIVEMGDRINCDSTILYKRAKEIKTNILKAS